MRRFLFASIAALTTILAVADQKISQLPAAAPLTGSEAIPAVQPGSCTATGGTCQTTPAAIATYVDANGQVAATAGGTGTQVAPTPAQVPIGNSGGGAYTPKTISGDASLASTGTITVSATHLSAPLATSQGGTGAASLATANIPVFSGSITTGDCVNWLSATSITDSGAPCGNATQLNGLAVPTNAPVLGTNSLGQLISETTPNLGTPSAINLTNATALPASALPTITGDVVTSGAGNLILSSMTTNRLQGLLKGVPIANESTMMDGSWTTVYAANTRKQYIAVRNSPYLRAAFAGFYSYAVNATAPITITASLEISGGATRYPLTFGGSTTGIVSPGAVLVSDPIYAKITAGNQFWIWEHAEGPNVLFQGTNQTVSSWGEGNDAAFNVARADLTVTGTAPGPNTVAFMTPLAIVGDAAPGQPYVMHFGDSISMGLGDTASISSSGRGYLRRAMANGIAFVNVGVSGMAYTNANPIFYQFAQGCTDVVDEMGINDIRNSATAATVESRIIASAVALGIYGSRVWHTTYLPITSSTDTWATATNQTPSAFEAVRVAVNDWIRGGAPVNNSTSLTPVSVGTGGALLAGQAGHPLRGYIETANAIEVNSSNVLTQDGGRWQVGSVYLTDSLGLHPNSTGYATIAAGINTTIFAGY